MNVTAKNRGVRIKDCPYFVETAIFSQKKSTLRRAFFNEVASCGAYEGMKTLR